jgi:hypothetical protein
MESVKTKDESKLLYIWFRMINGLHIAEALRHSMQKIQLCKFRRVFFFFATCIVLQSEKKGSAGNLLGNLLTWLINSRKIMFLSFFFE